MHYGHINMLKCQYSDHTGIASVGACRDYLSVKDDLLLESRSGSSGYDAHNASRQTILTAVTTYNDNTISSAVTYTTTMNILTVCGSLHMMPIPLPEII